MGREIGGGGSSTQLLILNAKCSQNRRKTVLGISCYLECNNNNNNNNRPYSGEIENGKRDWTDEMWRSRAEGRMLGAGDETDILLSKS
jgi:hypothetical protein